MARDQRKNVICQICGQQKKMSEVTLEELMEELARAQR
jgi:hypothetical protein